MQSKRDYLLKLWDRTIDKFYLTQEFFLQIKYSIKSVCRGLYSIWVFIPTLYNIRFWDASYIYILIARHLELTYNSLSTSPIVISKKELRKLKTAVVVANRLHTKDYYHPWKEGVKKELEAVWGDAIEITVCTATNTYTLPAPKKRVNIKLACDRQEKLAEYDRQYLFTLLNKHIDKWW